MIERKRIYDIIDKKDDSYKVLVDRLWPRWISKEKAGIDIRIKDIAPSNGLRKEFWHDIAKRENFKNSYIKELESDKNAVWDIIDIIKKHKKVTLVYSARDTEHNNAVVLQEFLQQYI